MTAQRNGPGALAGATEAERNITARKFSPSTEHVQAAALGVPRDKRASRRMMLRSFRPLTKGALRGFATVELPIGLVIRDIPVLLGRNGAWASLPAKPQLDQDARQKRDANSRLAYAAVLECRDRDLAVKFSVEVVELVRAAHPNALDEAAL